MCPLHSRISRFIRGCNLRVHNLEPTFFGFWLKDYDLWMEDQGPGYRVQGLGYMF